MATVDNSVVNVRRLRVAATGFTSCNVYCRISPRIGVNTKLNPIPSAISSMLSRSLFPFEIGGFVGKRILAKEYPGKKRVKNRPRPYLTYTNGYKPSGIVKKDIAAAKVKTMVIQ